MATFSLGKQTPCIHGTACWVDPRDSRDVMTNSKILCKGNTRDIHSWLKELNIHFFEDLEILNLSSLAPEVFLLYYSCKIIHICFMIYSYEPLPTFCK
jgi:hypothetical protein